jgi:hypothetical protein
MAPSIIRTHLQHICTESCTMIQLCIAIQHTSSLAYLEYIEVPSCASTAAVLSKITEKFGSNSRRNVLKQWLLLRKKAISEVDVCFVGTQLPPFPLSLC